MSVVAAGAGLLVIGVLIESDETTPRVHVPSEALVRPAPAAVAAAPSARPREAQRPARTRPSGVGEVFAQDRTITSPELGAWTLDAALDPQTRYAALRRLESQDPAAAVTAAVDALTDTTPLVRLNAIALLGRSKDPRATAALATLDERSRRLASFMARR